jgi:hypothetical protein
MDSDHGNAVVPIGLGATITRREIIGVGARRGKPAIVACSLVNYRYRAVLGRRGFAASGRLARLILSTNTALETLTRRGAPEPMVGTFTLVVGIFGGVMGGLRATLGKRAASTSFL